jgi:hypothetical protein
MANAMIRVVTFITTLLLRLHNDVWVEGTHLPFGGYIAKVEGGTTLLGVDDVKEVRPYNREFAMVTQIIARMSNNNVSQRTDRKEDKVDIFHFVQTVDGVAWRIITNIPSPQEVDAYRMSVATHAPASGLMAIETGDWEFNFLLRMMKVRGTKFRVAIIPNKEMTPSRINSMFGKSTFAWANAGYSFFLRIDGDSWGLNGLGLTAFDTLKVSKRLQEVCRLSEMHLYVDDVADFRLVTYPRPTGMNVGSVDGKSFVSKAFALRLAYSATGKRRKHLVRGIEEGTITSFSIRVMGPFGLIKGDAYIHSDVNAPFDVLTDAENIKTDIITNGYVFATIWEHHTMNRAKWDDQSAINFPFVLMAENRMADLNLSMAKIRKHIANGEVPEDLMLPEDSHNDDGTPNMERLSDMLRNQRVRWQAAGLDLRMAQNLLYMYLNGFIKSMERDEVGGSGFYKKTHVAMSNAFVGTVATWSLLTKVGGYRFPDQDGTKVFFDERFGLVIPDQRFVETFDLHGTWDLDDTVKAVFVRVFGDADHIAGLKADGVLPAGVEIPTTQSDAVDMVAFIRSPNGPGEISFEVMDEETMPWFDFDENRIPTVNLNNVISQNELLAQNAAGQLPTSIRYTKNSLLQAHALRMITAQQGNPGIGATANAVMVWYNTFHTMPVMAGTLGDIVDAVQQGADPISFGAVEQGASIIWENFVNTVLSSNVRVDEYVIRSRAPRDVIEQLRPRFGKGRLAKFHDAYAKAIKELRDEVMMQTMQMRQANEMTANVVGLNFSADAMQWAENTHTAWNRQLRAIDNDHRYNRNNCDPFTALTLECMQGNARKQAVDGFIRQLLDSERPHQRVMAIWKYVLTPTSGKPLGHSDRVMFQPGTEMSVMDLLIQALALRGWGHEVPLP